MSRGEPLLLLDEHIPLVVAEGLRNLGVEVQQVSELGLAGEVDAVVLQEAITRGRILVTRDHRDFLRLAAFHIEEGSTIPGILLVPSSISERHPGDLVRALRRWVKEKAGRDEPVRPVFEWLRSPRTERDGGRVREARPSYARALERVG